MSPARAASPMTLAARWPVEVAPRDVGGGGLPVVLGDHFEVCALYAGGRGVGFEAAALSAAADAAVDDGADVPEFPRKSVGAQKQLAVHDYAGAESGAEGYDYEVVEISSAAVDFFAEGGGVGVVAEVYVLVAHGHAQGFDERRAAAERQVRGVVYGALVIVAVGGANANPEALAVGVGRQKGYCPFEPLHIRGEIVVVGRLKLVAFEYRALVVDGAELGIRPADVYSDCVFHIKLLRVFKGFHIVRFRGNHKLKVELFYKG